MIQTINIFDFRDAFHRMGRTEQFSNAALKVIFDYIEDYERDSGEQVELDPIAICCDWAEDTPEGIAIDHDIDLEGVEEDDIHQAVMDYLCDSTHAEDTGTGTIVYIKF
jgi:hypothetical protein